MSEIDWSRAPTATSYADQIGGIGDALSLMVKRREEKRRADEQLALKRDAENRLWAGQRDEAEYRAGELGIKRQHETQDERRYSEGRNHQALAAIQAHLANGDQKSAAATAQEYGLPFEVHHDGPAPAAPDEEPIAPLPPDRPDDVPLVGPMRLLPPEVRAMISRGAAAGQTKEAPPPPSEALDAYVPQQFGRPEQSTQPPPADGGDAVDQELNKGRAAELAAYEEQEKARAASQASLRQWEASVQSSRQGSEQAGAQGMRDQGAAEARYADESAAYPAAKARFQQETDSLPARRLAYENSGTAHVTLPGDRAVDLPSTEDLRYGPRQRDAADFRRAQLAPLEAQLASAKTPEQIMRLRGQIENVNKIAASVEAGAEDLGKAGKALQTQDIFGEKLASGENEGELNRENRTTNARISANAAAKRAGLNRPAPGEPDTKVETRYQTDVAEVKKNSLAQSDMKDFRTIDKLNAELADPNGPQFQLAMDNITKLAVGGRAPVLLEQNMQNAIGLFENYANKVYKTTHNGRSMPSVVDAYRKAMADTKAVADAQRRSDADAFEEKAGIRSHWFTVPEMRARVLDNGRAYYRQLGLPLPPGYGDGQQGAPAGAAPVRATPGRKPTKRDILDEIEGL